MPEEFRKSRSWHTVPRYWIWTGVCKHGTHLQDTRRTVKSSLIIKNVLPPDMSRHAESSLTAIRHSSRMIVAAVFFKTLVRDDKGHPSRDSSVMLCLPSSNTTCRGYQIHKILHMRLFCSLQVSLYNFTLQRCFNLLSTRENSRRISNTRHANWHISPLTVGTDRLEI